MVIGSESMVFLSFFRPCQKTLGKCCFKFFLHKQGFFGSKQHQKKHVSLRNYQNPFRSVFDGAKDAYQKNVVWHAPIALRARIWNSIFQKDSKFSKKISEKTFFRKKLKFRRFLDPFQKTLQKCCFEHFCCKNMVFRVPTTSNKTMLPLGIDKNPFRNLLYGEIDVPSQKYVWLAPIAGSARANLKFHISKRSKIFERMWNFKTARAACDWYGSSLKTLQNYGLPHCKRVRLARNTWVPTVHLKRGKFWRTKQ